MGLRIGVRISTKEIDRKVAALQRMEEIANRYGDLAVELAQRYVRVDTGDLQKSIRKEVRLTAKSILVRILAGEGLKDGRAPANEYGTHVMSAQPYIRPALEQIRGPMLEELRQLMR